MPVSIGKLQSSLMLSHPVFIVRNSGNAKCLGSKGLQLLVSIYRDSTSFSDLLTFVISLTNEDILEPYKKEYLQFYPEPLLVLRCCIIVCSSAIRYFQQEKIISVLRLTSLGSFLMDYEKYICLTFTAQNFQRISQNKIGYACIK